jgi:hypothetical protein
MQDEERQGRLAPETTVTFGLMNELMERYEQTLDDIQPIKQELKPLEEERKFLKDEIVRHLDFVPNARFIGRHKLAERTETRRFSKPKTLDDAEKFVEFVRGRGELITILHSSAVSSYCENIWKEQEERGVLEPEIPGIGKPYIQYGVSLTQAKEVK